MDKSIIIKIILMIIFAILYHLVRLFTKSFEKKIDVLASFFNNIYSISLNYFVSLHHNWRNRCFTTASRLHHSYRTIASCGSKKILILLFVFLNFSLFAQLSISTSTTFNILQNSQLVNSDFIHNNGTIKNQGVIITKGDLINNSVFYSATGSTIVFNGINRQDIFSTIDTLSFFDAVIDNPSGIYLSSDLVISNCFYFNQGFVNTYNYSTPANLNTLFFYPTATKPSENEDSHIIGQAYMNSRNVGTSSLDFLSCYIQTGVDDIGNVSISRINGQQGIVTYDGNTSIASNWTIESDYNPVNGRNIDFSWFSDFDNNKDTLSAIVWTSEIPFVDWNETGTYQNVSSSEPRTVNVFTNQFSKWTVSDKELSLPVSLIDFSAFFSDNNVLLNWTTVTELNSDYFEVQRSYNSIDFHPIGTVKAHGYSLITQFYSFIDFSPDFLLYKYIYYRLKNTDFDGKFSFSNIVAVTADQYSDIKIFPNPTYDKIFINSGNNITESINIKIFNNIGLLCFDMYLNTDIHEQIIDLSNFSPGLFYIVIESNGYILKTQPIIKL